MTEFILKLFGFRRAGRTTQGGNVLGETYFNKSKVRIDISYKYTKDGHK